MKKQLTLTLSERELDTIMYAIDFCEIHFINDRHMKNMSDKCFKVRKKLEKLIPDVWGWIGE